jgi:hypothetical protein
MSFTPFRLADAIGDLAAIEDEGQLKQLLTDHALQCRRISLPPDAELYLPDADVRADRLARCAAQLLDVPIRECQSAARELFRRHPRREIALELIDWYRGRHDPERQASTVTVNERPQRRAGRPLV